MLKSTHLQTGGVKSVKSSTWPDPFEVTSSSGCGSDRTGEFDGHRGSNLITVDRECKTLSQVDSELGLMTVKNKGWNSRKDRWFPLLYEAWEQKELVSNAKMTTTSTVDYALLDGCSFSRITRVNKKGRSGGFFFQLRWRYTAFMYAKLSWK